MRYVAIVAICAGMLLAASSANAQGSGPDKTLERDFQAAVEQYDAGHFAEAAARLEKLLPKLPESFEVHELLGLVYSAESQDAKANEHLEKAVRLNPDSAPARTNLAANLVRLGKTGPAEDQFRKAAQLEPENFDANHNLGEAYVRDGKIVEATPFLEKAQRIDPSSYDQPHQGRARICADLAETKKHRGAPQSPRRNRRKRR